MLYDLQEPPAGFTEVSLKLNTSLSEISLQHLQFLALQGLVQPKRFPRAMFFTLTTLLLMLAPVFFTNWKILDLAGCLRLGWMGLGLNDLEFRVTDKECDGVLARG